MREDVGTLVGTLSGIDVVGFLVEDVVDAVDQKIEGEGHPDQDGQDFPGPQLPSQPHPHNRGSDGVYPENWSGDFN